MKVSLINTWFFWSAAPLNLFKNDILKELKLLRLGKTIERVLATIKSGYKCIQYKVILV